MWRTRRAGIRKSSERVGGVERERSNISGGKRTNTTRGSSNSGDSMVSTRGRGCVARVSGISIRANSSSNRRKRVGVSRVR